MNDWFPVPRYHDAHVYLMTLDCGHDYRITTKHSPGNNMLLYICHNTACDTIFNLHYPVTTRRLW